MDIFREWKKVDYKKSYEMEPTRKKNEEDLKLPGRKGLEDCWGKRD